MLVNIVGFPAIDLTERKYISRTQRIIGVCFRQYVHLCIGEKYLKANKYLATETILKTNWGYGCPHPALRPPPAQQRVKQSMGNPIRKTHVKRHDSLKERYANIKDGNWTDTCWKRGRWINVEYSRDARLIGLSRPPDIAPPLFSRLSFFK